VAYINNPPNKLIRINKSCGIAKSQDKPIGLNALPIYCTLLTKKMSKICGILYKKREEKEAQMVKDRNFVSISRAESLESRVMNGTGDKGRAPL
jgi:hypothetical protein